MGPKKSRSPALLSELEPTLTLRVQHSTNPFHRSRRTLQLRGPVIVLSKRSTPEPATDKLIVLGASSDPVVTGSTQVTLQQHRLSFESSQARDLFLKAVRSAIRQASAGADKYVKLVEIGHGASGRVYLVRRKADGEMFALKMVNKIDVFMSPHQLSNLIRERIALAEAASRYSPFIIRLVDAFETKTHLNFVTELGGMGDLREVLKLLPEHRLEEDVAKRLFAEIVMSVEEMHRMGYLYRDLKLANLLMTKTGHVKLADLGLVKRLQVEYMSSSASSDSEGEDDEEFRLVGRTSTFVGTRRYMSPEHLASKTTRGYGAPADIWALGVTLYVMLTGNFPFGRDVESRNVTDMFYAISQEEILFPEFLSQEAVGMLKGLLDRDVLERFDLREIKQHAWMTDVEWSRIKREAMLDEPVEEVLKVLEKGGVKSIEQRLEMVSRDMEQISWVFDEKDGKSKSTEKGVWGGMELVGFGFSSSSSSSSSS